MPTGYTADISNGITFRQYAMGCARAFGALITMRDEPSDAPIPDSFQPSKYHEECLQTASDRLAQLRLMSLDETELAADTAYREAVEANTTRIREKNDLRAKYSAMLAQVEAWKPPTPDHEEYHRFMVSQIRESIDFDCDTSFYEDNQPERLSGGNWLAQQIQEVERSINYHTRANAEEIARTNGRSGWVKALRDSLPAE